MPATYSVPLVDSERTEDVMTNFLTDFGIRPARPPDLELDDVTSTLSSILQSFSSSIQSAALQAARSCCVTVRWVGSKNLFLGLSRPLSFLSLKLKAKANPGCESEQTVVSVWEDKPADLVKI